MVLPPLGSPAWASRSGLLGRATAHLGSAPGPHIRWTSLWPPRLGHVCPARLDVAPLVQADWVAGPVDGHWPLISQTIS